MEDLPDQTTSQNVHNPTLVKYQVTRNNELRKKRLRRMFKKTDDALTMHLLKPNVQRPIPKHGIATWI